MLLLSCSYLVIFRLLFQFHKQQNSKKPGSVHAVYLVTGYIVPVTPTSSAHFEQADGEDAHMQSSPFMSSSMPQQEEEEERLSVKTVTLCREEDLEGEEILHSKPGLLHNYKMINESHQIRGQSEIWRESIYSCIQLGAEHHTGTFISNKQNSANAFRISNSCPSVIEQ